MTHNPHRYLLLAVLWFAISQGYAIGQKGTVVLTDGNTIAYHSISLTAILGVLDGADVKVSLEKIRAIKLTNPAIVTNRSGKTFTLQNPRVEGPATDPVALTIYSQVSHEYETERVPLKQIFEIRVNGP